MAFLTMVSIVLLLLAPTLVLGFDQDYLRHAGLSGTEHSRRRGDPNFYETNDGRPILPGVGGFKGSHGKFELDLWID